MQLFLHIQVTNEPLFFSFDAIPPVKKWVPEVSIFDMDSHSDAVTIQTAIKAMQEAEKTFISIAAEAGTELGGTLKILNQVMRMSSPVAIYYTGDHEMLNNIMSRFRDKVIDRETGIEVALKEFFNPPS